MSREGVLGMLMQCLYKAQSTRCPICTHLDTYLEQCCNPLGFDWQGVHTTTG